MATFVEAEMLDRGERFSDGHPRLVGGTLRLTVVAEAVVPDEDFREITVPAGTSVIGTSSAARQHPATVYVDGRWLRVSFRAPVKLAWRAPEVGVGERGADVRIRWDSIHAACRAVDEARAGQTSLGVLEGGVGDVFGGTYHGPHFEGRGIPGLVSIATAANRLAHQAWDIVHGARNKGTPQTLVSAALRTAMEVHALRTELAATGIEEYDPESTICGIHAHKLNVTGLLWLAGFEREQLDNEMGVPLAAVHAYLDGGAQALRAALEATESAASEEASA